MLDHGSERCMLLLAVLHVVSHARSASPIKKIIEYFEFEKIQILFILSYSSTLCCLRPQHSPQASRVAPVEEKTKQSAELEQYKNEETRVAALDKSTVANMASSIEVC